MAAGLPALAIVASGPMVSFDHDFVNVPVKWLQPVEPETLPSRNSTVGAASAPASPNTATSSTHGVASNAAVIAGQHRTGGRAAHAMQSRSLRGRDRTTGRLGRR